ncbi:DUF6177 family protein, partial [Streptomyces sp. TRM76130]|nr:DUF6177 family protein [Streptomyces sp. TRM76130]
LVAVGHPRRPALAAVRVVRTPAGVEEDITLTLGHGTDEEVPTDAVEGLAAELDAEHGLCTLLTSLRRARRDLTVPARPEPPPVPATLTLSHQEVDRVGRARAEH